MTDSGREIIFDEVGKPGVANLLTILAALTGTDIGALVDSSPAAATATSRLRWPTR